MLKKTYIFTTLAGCALFLVFNTATVSAQQYFVPGQQDESRDLSEISPDPEPFKSDISSEKSFKESVTKKAKKFVKQTYENKLCPNIHNIYGEVITYDVGDGVQQCESDSE